MKNYKFLIISFVFLIIFSINASAFAVTSYYWDDHPLILKPGETKEIKAFGLQNLVGGEDMIATATLGSGKEIAQMIDNSNVYLVPFGRKDVYINLRITIPQDAPLGKEYSVGVSFSTRAKNEGKTVQLTTGIDSSIKIIVGKEAEEKIPVQAGTEEKKSNAFNGLLFGVIALFIVVIAIIIYYFGLMKKVSKRR